MIVDFAVESKVQHDSDAEPGMEPQMASGFSKRSRMGGSPLKVMAPMVGRQNPQQSES